LGTVSLGRSGPPDGQAPDIVVQFRDMSGWLDIATGGSMGAAESYMAGKWSTSDLTGLIRVFLANRAALERLDSGLARLGSPLLRAAHWYHRNTQRGSRQNIRAHYDLGNELFALFLDPTMMYSAAVFPGPDTPLEEASVHKLDLDCRKLELRPED